MAALDFGRVNPVTGPFFVEGAWPGDALVIDLLDVSVGARGWTACIPGTRLVLPIGVEGALLSPGDAHAAMGDGEVCGTGVETGATVRLRVGLRPGRRVGAP